MQLQQKPSKKAQKRQRKAARAAEAKAQAQVQQSANKSNKSKKAKSKEARAAKAQVQKPASKSTKSKKLKSRAALRQSKQKELRLKQKDMLLEKYRRALGIDSFDRSQYARIFPQEANAITEVQTSVLNGSTVYNEDIVYLALRLEEQRVVNRHNEDQLTRKNAEQLLNHICLKRNVFNILDKPERTAGEDVVNYLAALERRVQRSPEIFQQELRDVWAASEARKMDLRIERQAQMEARYKNIRGQKELKDGANLQQGDEAAVKVEDDMDLDSPWPDDQDFIRIP